MTISDETLMAYADDELDRAARDAVESAMRKDPQIEKRVAQHRALRQRMQAAYAAELTEEVPQRLLSAANRRASTPRSSVVNPQDARTARARSAPHVRPVRPRWRTAGTIAASLTLGAGLGFLMWGRTESPLTRIAGGALVARGELADALSNQLVAEQSRSGPVLIGLSFLSKSGHYCRTFELSGDVSPSGVACRQGEEWRVRSLTQAAGDQAGDGKYRAAGSSMPAAILKSVEGEIAGEPLDQAGELAARSRGWKSAEL